MACTRNLAASVRFCRPYLSYQPVSVAGDDPAITAANFVKQTILGPPFDWMVNRTESTLALTAGGGQNVVLAAPNFGHLTRAWLRDGTGVVKPLNLQTSLGQESSVQRPAGIAAQADDNAGNITFRLNTLPDQNYSLGLLWQHKALPMTSLAATWAPLPDELSYIYDWGFLAYLSLLVKDARMPVFRQMFLSHLLGRQTGLDALQRNIFLGNFLDNMVAPLRAQGINQAGVAGLAQ